MTRTYDRNRRSAKPVASTLAAAIAFLSFRAAAAPGDNLQVARPETTQRQPASEYFTSTSGAGVLIRVNIWGDVQRPGVHFVPLGSTLVDSLGSAGGPAATATYPEVELVRAGASSMLDASTAEGRQPLKDNDLLFVHRSFKSDLPLLYSAISAIVSVATLYVVLSREKK